ncbi:hypothetical protein [Salibacterium halotolerans]|uniref:Glycosyl-4,4'-diaponeurosporenoate acyltransferase n=1 Tax=Salibacterium halotolerans TaxID=1884432 RepID=A0A1I5L4N4_9BACI|nr:hypothetical protein [Salibacterium halotolerans]SFO92279.1 glycosyl-4,4'-diaponeurosporenoate acyltransferase [Salibacterium halotolerans]
MPLVELPLYWVVILDILAWGVFHMAASAGCYYMPARWFSEPAGLYRIRNWERGGHFWQKYLRVKSWKHLVPDGAAMFQNGFAKKQLQQQDAGYLGVFVLESRRAELTHWFTILPCVLFFLWNPLWAAWLNVFYALTLNIPIIILQRTNRARLERVTARRKPGR